MHLEAAFERWGAVLALAAFVILGKFLILLVSAARAGETPETAFRTGISLAQISEFSFVFAALAIGEGYIDEGILSIIGAVGLLTIGGSSYLILSDTALYRWTQGAGWLRPFGAGTEIGTASREETRDHVIVVGMNALGRRIVHALLQRGEAVVAIDNDPRKLEELPCPTVLGTAEHLSVLAEAGLERAEAFGLGAADRGREQPARLPRQIRRRAHQHPRVRPQRRRTATGDRGGSPDHVEKCGDPVAGGDAAPDGESADMIGIAIFLGGAALAYGLSKWLHLPPIPLLIPGRHPFGSAHRFSAGGFCRKRWFSGSPFCSSRSASS